MKELSNKELKCTFLLILFAYKCLRMKGLLEVKQKFLNNQETYYCLPTQYKPPNYIHFTRSNYAKVFSEKGVLKKFAKFTGKHLCWSLFFNKVPSLRSATLLKKRLQHRCLPGNFVKFLGTLFLRNTSVGCFCHTSLFMVQQPFYGVTLPCNNRYTIWYPIRMGWYLPFF